MGYDMYLILQEAKGRAYPNNPVPNVWSLWGVGISDAWASTVIPGTPARFSPLIEAPKMMWCFGS